MITGRHHNCWTLIHLSANPGSNMHIQPPHRGVDWNLKLIWVTWYQNAGLIWVMLFAVKHAFVPLIRPSVNTDECLRSLLTCDYSGRKCQHGVAAKASKRPRRHLSTPPPPPLLLCGILKLQQPKCFYNQVKKKGGIKKSRRIYIWDDWKIKSLKIPQRD